MTLDEIMTLVKAGYTKEEIQALQTPAQPAQSAPEEAQPAPEQKPEEPKEAPAAAVQPQQDAILDALNRLTNTIISHNTNGTIMQQPERTIDQALAEIIAPPAKK